MFLCRGVRNFRTRDGEALKRAYSSSVQKYREISGGNEEKTPEFWVWREKKRCFWGKYVILRKNRNRR